MTEEVRQILEFLHEGYRPSVNDLEAKGYSSESIKAVMANAQVRSVKAIHLGNGAEVTRLVFADLVSDKV